MNIAIIGATGFVGTALLNEAVLRGHSVTAISRHPEKIQLNDDKVTSKEVDVFDGDHLAEVLEGHDAVLSAYNSGWGNPNIYDDYMKGAEAIQNAVREAGISRFLVVGGAGSLEGEEGQQLVDSPDFPKEHKDGALAARDYLDILRSEEGLEWTLLSPAVEMHPEVDSGRTGEYRKGQDQPVFDDRGKSQISVEDLAVALLDELENNEHIQQRFTVGY